jgi:hypothetical protein
VIVGALARALAVLAVIAWVAPGAAWGAEALLHPKYQLPAASFAYVGDPANPATWKLPYRHADGSVDPTRLPHAIEAVLGTYRGRTVTIPNSARHTVLVNLAAAADEIGRMPPKAAHPSPLYLKLAAALSAP